MLDIAEKQDDGLFFLQMIDRHQLPFEVVGRFSSEQSYQDYSKDCRPSHEKEFSMREKKNKDPIHLASNSVKSSLQKPNLEGEFLGRDIKPYA